MNKSVLFIAGVLLAALAIGVWPLSSNGQPPPPPEDDLDLMLDMGMGGPPDAPRGPAFRPEDRPGMHGPDEARGRRGMFKQKAMEKIRREDPERYKRITRIKELAMEYRESEDEKRKKQIEKELKPLVDQELRTQQENNKKRVEELEKKLKHMKKVLKQREENWDQVVDYTVKEVTGQNDYLHIFPGGRPRR